MASNVRFVFLQSLSVQKAFVGGAAASAKRKGGRFFDLSCKNSRPLFMFISSCLKFGTALCLFNNIIISEV